ncbi:hypothetical protein GUITHDRAFT_100192 [Guillardia theta CCMP2712]|uniref:Protein kinase domain-containing protein n=1 Tax=Guillardia theta (strain CCMP2712) TaxID=905079 RepID=L1K001_GUITC|nr:hypothetical protein GUITHDRAFT_100192 [Guillardia theta CCMP2712]EKX53942.1 hypothetical protein GUITHDRAFT_100192 [Guillardia theta CCMP2712]|eukprot:XP_005840922.1 hypothetical protein GUITHDRAFT_100192 [Guillardia theta CCMP2712]
MRYFATFSMAPNHFKIQSRMPDKKGQLKKFGKILGRTVSRWYKIEWQGPTAVLLAYKTAAMTGAPKVISLENCFVKACQEKDTKAAEAGYCIELEVKLENSKKIHHFFADSEIDRSEWVQAIRKSAVNSSIDNGYEIHRNDKNSKLGSGSYSTVWKCYDRESRKTWALKEMMKSNVKKEEEEYLREEVKISTLVGSHDHIVYMKEFVENKDRYYIVLEFLSGGELFDRIVDAEGGHFTEKDAAGIMCQLMGALAYLHSKKIAHRDLKPENFLLVEHTSIQSAVVKIADFGFACHAETSNGLHGLCGSPGYVAPEILKEEGGYGLPVDMWSMGVILYILLSGIPPFAGESDEESFAMTIRGYYDNSCLNEVSSAGQDLVAKMLTYNPAKRITAADCLKHPWLTGSAGDKVLAVQENLRSWRARMRFKKAIIATVATTRLHAIMRRAAQRPDAKRAEPG